MDSRPVQIGIVAGEPSGDRLAAGLIGALKFIYPNAGFAGIGGPAMRAAGCHTLYDMERIELMGFDGLFGRMRDILKIRSAIYRRFITHPPHLFVGIDVPDFNLALERRLKRKNIPTVHYVSPTVWAWRGYRIHKIRRSVDHMLTLFPFEAEFYTRHRIPVTCVGHPVADEIGEPDQAAARKKIGLAADGKTTVIGLLPGSRCSEVQRLGAVFVGAAEKLHGLDATIQFVLPFASSRVERAFYDVVGRINHLPITVLRGQSRIAMEASDMVILASGTAALEAALLRVPHVVVYKLSPVTYWLFQKLRHVDYYSMPNQLLPEPVIPELVQKDATAHNIVQAVNQYRQNPEKVRKLEQDFIQMHKALKRDANMQAGRAVATLLDSVS